MGRDGCAAGIGEAHRDVSIHAPVWGATRLVRILGAEKALFQSTRPCGARHDLDLSKPVCVVVSIHAPVWGATLNAERRAAAETVSIHAPVWGATREIWYGFRWAQVSIHAPVWGAT